MDRMRLSIGTMAERTGTKVETIRYYESIGILPPPPRTEGKHRAYSEEHLKRLTFVRRSRALGFTLDDIRDLLRLVDGGNATCDQINGIALRHLTEVQAKIADLKRMENILKSTTDRCTGHDIPECPILDALYTG